MPKVFLALVVSCCKEPKKEMTNPQLGGVGATRALISQHLITYNHLWTRRSSRACDVIWCLSGTVFVRTVPDSIVKEG